MSNFDYNCYARRQFRIWAIIFGAWLSIIICGLVAKYAGIEDRNVAELILFISFTSFLVLAMGLYVSFTAWVEKRVFQYGEKVKDDDSK